MLTVLVALGAMAIAGVLTARLTRPGSVFYVLDHPNERSLHEQPVPRAGGIAIISAIWLGAIALALMGFTFTREAVAIVVVSSMVGIISFIDDRRHLPVATRLAVHGAAAIALVFSGVMVAHIDYPGVAVPLVGWAAMVLSALFIVWMANLYNFMDGMDGLAAGMAVFGFGAYALLGAVAGASSFAALNLLIAAAAAGFLLFNFPPARIFMGDVGSSALGIAAAAMTLWGARDGIFPFWIGLLIFSPFLVDATVTLFRRILSGEPFWRAHKSHYYQRVVRAGWGHRRTLIAEYVLMATVALVSIWAASRSVPWQWIAFGCVVALYGMLATRVHRLERSSFRDG